MKLVHFLFMLAIAVVMLNGINISYGQSIENRLEPPLPDGRIITPGSRVDAITERLGRIPLRKNYQPSPGKYFIRTALATRYLDAVSILDDGTYVQLYDDKTWERNADVSNQIWELIRSPEAEYYYIKLEKGGYLDVQWGNNAPGTRVHIWPSNGGDAQKWKFVSNDLGKTFTIQSKLGTFLEVKEAAAQNGTDVWMGAENAAPAQQWFFDPAFIAGKQVIQTRVSFRYLDVTGVNPNAGTAVQIWDGNGGWWNQIWEIIPSPESGYYYIKSEGGRYLDVQWGGRAAGTPVHIWDFNGGDAQKWKVKAVDNKTFTIQSKLGTFLDVKGAQPGNGTQVWAYSGYDTPPAAQQWIFSSAGAGNVLRGFVDMHTHPMSHLAFGGMIMYGAPDIGSLMLRGQIYKGFEAYFDWGLQFKKNCNANPEDPAEKKAENLWEALGFCNSVHGSPGFGTTTFGDANNCGDVIRAAIVDKLEEKYIHEYPNPAFLGKISDHPRKGNPEFVHWPHWSSVSHQQMYWEWIKRAYDGGLRVMVALSVNNSLLAKAANAQQYVDDKSSIELQLREIEYFVGRHSDFMEIAKTPADIRRIIWNNRMAVILGVETDDFGNLSRRANFTREPVTESTVKEEITKLYDLGVRYIFPIHLSNSILGGYAINRDLFDLGSKFYTNNFPQLRETCGEGIHFELKRSNMDFPEPELLRTRDLGWVIDAQPNYTPPASGCGHANSLDLTPLGEAAVQHMMNLGMMIDMDHMSQLAVKDLLDIAQSRNYPINSGHNGLRGEECGYRRDSANLRHCNENSRTREQYMHISRLGGMIGLGHGGRSSGFISHYKRVLDLLGDRPIAIGTDANGLEALPAPDPNAPVRYDGSFPKYKFQNRTWDINSKIVNGKETGDGFAHYGLFPDYIRSWRSSSDPAVSSIDRIMTSFMSSAEGFAQMWERCERQKVVR